MEKAILIFRPDRLPDEITGNTILPVLPGVELTLTAEQLFAWLQR